MKIEEVRSKTDSELEYEIGQMSQQLFELRFKAGIDRKSTRLNSSHVVISYAVFCLKKKNKNKKIVVLDIPLLTITSLPSTQTLV